MRRKTQSTDTFYINNDYTNVTKVYEDYIEFDTKLAENKKSAEKQKNIFLKNR